MKRVLALLVTVVVLACGKRGDPRPPVPIIPQATSDLVVTQRSAKLILSWSYPALTTAGRSLTDVRRIVVYRHVEELPAPQAGRALDTMLPGDVDPTIPRAVALFAKLPALVPSQFTRLRTRVESIESANLPAASTGARLTFEDAPPLRTTDGRPVRLTYAVVTEGPAGEGDLSNLASIIPLDVAVAPAGLAAAPSPEGVTLTWTAPSEAVTGAGITPFVLGYNVYRTAPGQAPDLSSAPINPAPVTATTYIDRPPYGAYEYRVTSIASTTPRVESAQSTVIAANFRDRVAPPVPTNVTPLIEIKAVRLIWEPVEAADLAGYRIYRTEGVGHDADIRDAGTIPLVLEPLTATTYIDRGVDLGIAYRYAVTAIDKSGNESARKLTPWVVAPKTP